MKLVASLNVVIACAWSFIITYNLHLSHSYLKLYVHVTIVIPHSKFPILKECYIVIKNLALSNTNLLEIPLSAKIHVSIAINTVLTLLSQLSRSPLHYQHGKINYCIHGVFRK